MNYKVIWFDDEYESLNLFKEQSALNDIKLTGFTNSYEGQKELEANIEQYDAAILDGKFLTKPDENLASMVEDKALFQVATTLERLSDRKKIPWFILSGQMSFTREVNRYADGFKNNVVYDKGSKSDWEKLWRDLKAAVNNLPETQIKHDNKSIFDIFNQGYLDSSVEHQVLRLLMQPKPKNKVELKGVLTNIRSVHESIFNKLEEIGIIPDSQARLSQIVKHLSGNRSDASNFVPTTSQYQNNSIENLHKWVHFTCSNYIHNLRDDNYNDYMISNYAVESLKNGLLEILLWFKKTYEDKTNPNP